MVDTGPSPDTESNQGPELAHMEQVRAVRQAANARMSRALELYRQAHAAVTHETEAKILPHTQAYIDAIGPIIEGAQSLFAEMLRDYRAVVEIARQEADQAALELRLAHEAWLRRVEATRTRCENCNSIMPDEGPCRRCNGEPAQVAPKRPLRARVQA